MMIAVLAEPAGVNFSIHELQVVNDSLMLFLSVAVTGRRWLSLHVVYASNRGCFFPDIQFRDQRVTIDKDAAQTFARHLLTPKPTSSLWTSME